MAMIRVPSAALPAGTVPGAPVPSRGQNVALRALSRLVTAVRSNRKAT